MAAVRVKGIKKVRSKGRDYYYHRKSMTRINAKFGTAEFFVELAQLERAAHKAASLPGMLGAAIERYRRSTFFCDLAPATRNSYDRAFAVLEPLSPMPLVEATPAWVAGLRDEIAEKRGRWMANYAVVALSVVFEHARENGWMRDNPTRGIRKIGRDKSKPRANRPWTEAECRTVLDHAAPYLRVPIALAMFGGLRKGDVLRVTKSTLRDGVGRITTRKRGVDVTIPIHPILAHILASAPQHDALTIATNSQGQTWTESGFNATFGKFIDRLEQRGLVDPGLTMHGLRHTLGTRLREAGADLDTIRRVLGQKTLVMAQHYSETADNLPQAREAVLRLDILGNKKG
ncbi:tyrosine-type recombinase/integrase [Methylocystis sp.]|uniref:tyrosine-type recombinase/integrase n=1 Tax=Methylocystis sp. TaxID=1911079 RepID=UPI0025DEF9B2|nr:tyrosine-type recombinase/integrase [Methylocystis sp.]